MSSPLIRNQRDTLLDLIDSATGIGIIIGKDLNIDSVGASLGLYLTLQQQGKNVQIISRSEPNVAVSNLFGIDKVKKSFEGDTKILTISVPYRDGEIEKVSYNIEGDKLNVNLFAESNGISFSENDIDYIRKGSSPSLIITIGVASEEEIAGIVDLKAVKTIHIDNNPTNSLFGDVSLIDPKFSSLSEIVAGVIMDLNLAADQDGLQNIMDGIAYATRNFTRQDTSAFAFEAAGFLLQSGAKRKQGQNQDRGRDQRFPQESHFLNQQPRRNRPQGGFSQQRPQRNQRPDMNQQLERPQQQAPVMEPKQDVDAFDNFSNAPESQNEETVPDDIPEDWFLPKVFKGSKKGN